jgi:hypothetical protein
VQACAADRPGNLWFAVFSGDPTSGHFSQTIDRVTASGQVTEHVLAPLHLPASHGEQSQSVAPWVFGMTTGPDGSTWFTKGYYDTTSARGIVRISPSGHYRSFTVFPPGVNSIPNETTRGVGLRFPLP